MTSNFLSLSDPHHVRQAPAIAASAPPLPSTPLPVPHSRKITLVHPDPKVFLSSLSTPYRIASHRIATARPVAFPLPDNIATTSPAAAMMATPANHGRDPTQPVCQNCSTSTTPLWRRDEYGAVLCNACGLFLKLHGRPRPISLKTDVIKSRNRVKTMRPDLATKKKVCALPARFPPW